MQHLHIVHQEVRCQINHSNELYKQEADSSRHHIEFQARDLVPTRIKTERFPHGTLTKLQSQKTGPFKVLQVQALIHISWSYPLKFNSAPSSMWRTSSLMKGMTLSCMKNPLKPTYLKLKSHMMPLKKFWTISKSQQERLDIISFWTSRKGSRCPIVAGYRHRKSNDSILIFQKFTNPDIHRSQIHFKGGGN